MDDYLEFGVQDHELVLYVYNSSLEAEEIIMGLESIKNYIEAYEKRNDIEGR